MAILRRRSGRNTPTRPTPTNAGADGLVATIDEANFRELTVGAVTVVDFSAPWCGPCRLFAPVFEDAALRYQDHVRFGRCDVDDNPQLAALLGIMSIPTVIVFDPSGSEHDRIVGMAGPAALERLLDRALGHAAEGG